MESESENLFGNRLKMARKMAGMSLQDLANALNGAVTKQALNKYEMGQMRPNAEVLSLLSRILNVKQDYLLRRGQTEFGELSFRKKADLSKKDEDAALEKARDYVERFLEIENILDLEREFQNPLDGLLISNKNDVEAAAIQLRRAWELGTSPIPNLIEMLELKGVKVVLINHADSLDGFAGYTSGRIPVVVINASNKPIERLRFTVIHELAHILLKFSDHVKADQKLLETLCHFFASCFLVPTDVLLKLIGGSKRTYIAIKELIEIKEYCGISLRALVHRLKELEIISEIYYQKWLVYLSKTYGGKDEPGNYKGAENPRIFGQLVTRALSEGAISMSKAAALCNTNINNVRKGLISVN